MTELTDTAGLEQCLKLSEAAPIVLFKHSTVCPTSARAYEQVNAFLAQGVEGCPEFYLVKVIESRPVSNEIAARLGVRHKSPQIILVKGGQSLWTASHFGINVASISSALQTHGE